MSNPSVRPEIRPVFNSVYHILRRNTTAPRHFLDAPPFTSWQGAVFLILTARPGTWYNAYSISYQCGCSLLLDSGKTLLYEKQFEMQRKECSPMMITAHSGSDGTPDNSLEFVHYVLSLRPDAFEIDVHRRSDGVLVIAHDADPSGAYADCPTLAEVCRLAASLPQIGINYDCKEAGLELDVCALHSECCPGNPIFLSGTVSPALYRDRCADFRGAVPLLNAEEIVRDFYPRMLAGESAACGKEAAEACKSCGASVVNVYFPSTAVTSSPSTLTISALPFFDSTQNCVPTKASTGAEKSATEATWS